MISTDQFNLCHLRAIKFHSKGEIMQKTISRQIAEFAINLKYEDLPSEVINEVKRYLYDSIGCAYGGYHTKDVNI